MTTSSMPTPTGSVHVIQVLIRTPLPNGAGFLLHPHPGWRPSPDAAPYRVLPARKTVADPLDAFHRGQSVEAYVRELLEGELGLRPEDWMLEQEIEPVQAHFPAVHSGTTKTFTLCPVEVWVAPGARESLRSRLEGVWQTASEAMAEPGLAPSARAVFGHLLLREAALDTRYAAHPEEEAREESPHRLLRRVPERPSMYALASRWFSENQAGVRILSRQTLDAVLAAGSRAFNLRVADPYLRYQKQGIGCTWSFFTHKDRQDIHVHGAPSIEIYGVLEGRLEVWWKPYHDRGTSAWNHRVVGPGDWVEMESLQCHYVRWAGPGKGVVFKAGPGPLAEVGRLGVKGKTPCDQCPCIKPPELLDPPPAPRSEAGKPWGISVRGMVRDDQGRCLLLRRTADSRHYPGCWEFPGGKLDPGETPGVALEREVLEETGLAVRVEHLVGSAESELEHVKVVHLFFEARMSGGELRMSSEHAESCWADSRDWQYLEFVPAVRDFLKHRAPGSVP